MRYCILALLFLLLYAPAEAQDYEGGLMFGPSAYMGDLNKSIIEVDEINLSLGLFIRRYLNNRWSLRGNVYIAKTSGEDPREVRDFRFRADVYEISAMGEWHWFNRERFKTTGRRDNALDMYFLAGLGFAYVDSNSTGTGLPEDADPPNFIPVIPIGGGMKYDIFERTSIALDGGVRYTNTDYIDGVSLLANAGSNDYYLFLTINIGVLIDY
ncbi:MAG: DUF6089 family protein [Bacteroidota bacterium]